MPVCQPDLPCDSLSGQRTVPRDHQDADPRQPALLERAGDLRPRRVEDADEAEQLELGFDRVYGQLAAVCKLALRNSQHPETSCLHCLGGGKCCLTLYGGESSSFQHSLRRALDER